MAKAPLRQDKDKVGKWLLSAKGDSILHLAGVTGFTSWKSVQSELVAPRRLPDGIIEATFPGEEKPRLYLIELESYADNSVDPQVFEDILLVRLEKKVIPEVICVVLKPKGNVTVKGSRREVSTGGSVELSARWTVIEMWHQELDELLDRHDAGLVPLAALARFDGTIEERVRRCFEEIRRTTTPEDQEQVIVATSVFLQLFAGDDSLLFLLRRLMLLDDPAIRKAAETLFGETVHELAEEIARSIVTTEVETTKIEQGRQAVLRILEARFGVVPETVRARVGRIARLDRLNELISTAATCPDWTAFEMPLSAVDDISPTGN